MLFVASAGASLWAHACCAETMDKFAETMGCSASSVGARFATNISTAILRAGIVFSADAAVESTNRWQLS